MDRALRAFGHENIGETFSQRQISDSTKTTAASAAKEAGIQLSSLDAPPPPPREMMHNINRSYNSGLHFVENDGGSVTIQHDRASVGSLAPQEAVRMYSRKECTGAHQNEAVLPIQEALLDLRGPSAVPDILRAAAIFPNQPMSSRLKVGRDLLRARLGEFTTAQFASDRQQEGKSVRGGQGGGSQPPSPAKKKKTAGRGGGLNGPDSGVLKHSGVKRASLLPDDVVHFTLSAPIIGLPEDTKPLGKLMIPRPLLFLY